MAEFDKEMIYKRFQKFDELLLFLKEKHKITIEEFLTDKKQQLAIERALEILINICIDIGAHILKKLNINQTETYRDIFSQLANQKIISDNESTRMRELTGFRNILGHMYMEIDLEKEYNIFKNDLDALKNFKTAILKNLNLKN
jgi:uncharacterized protein YutE (UPF0331/DUF86 family)